MAGRFGRGAGSESRMWGYDKVNEEDKIIDVDENGRPRILLFDANGVPLLTDANPGKIEVLNMADMQLKDVVKTLQDNVSANVDGEALDVAGYGAVVFDVDVSESPAFNGLVNFEGTIDGTNWRKLFTFNKDQSYWTNDAGTSGVYIADVKGFAKVRGRISDHIEGSVTVVARATQQGDTRIVRVSEGNIDAVSSSTIVGREAETFTIASEADISTGVEQSIPNFSSWTCYLKAGDAVEITVELSPDNGTTWFEMSEAFVIGAGGGDEVVEGQYLVANAIKLSANNAEAVTAILRGLF